MTPEQKLIQIVDNARGDDLYRARAAFRNCSEAELDKEYGQSGKTRRQILREYEQEAELHKRARALLMEKLGAVGE